MRHNRNINIYRIHMHMFRTVCVWTVCVCACVVCRLNNARQIRWRRSNETINTFKYVIRGDKWNGMVNIDSHWWVPQHEIPSMQPRQRQHAIRCLTLCPVSLPFSHLPFKSNGSSSFDLVSMMRVFLFSNGDYCALSRFAQDMVYTKVFITHTHT